MSFRFLPPPGFGRSRIKITVVASLNVTRLMHTTKGKSRWVDDSNDCGSLSLYVSLTFAAGKKLFAVEISETREDLTRTGAKTPPLFFEAGKHGPPNPA